MDIGQTSKSEHVQAPDSAKLKEIEAKRAASKMRGISTKEPGATYARICPNCQKPNSLISPFCTGCTFELNQWDEEKLPNLFWNLVQGQDIGCRVAKRTEEVIVFHDKFPVSDLHLDIIPTKAIVDIASLTKADIPMLNGLYSAGLTELRNMNAARFSGKNLEDVIVAGFNYPVSIPHLHLHMVLPPFAHEKVFQYPRWHSFKKVVSDLEKYGAVRTYDKHENKVEWEPGYTKAMADHKAFSAPKKTRSKRLGPNQEFERWKKKSKDNTIVLIQADKSEHTLQLSIDGTSYSLKYPSSKDPESTFFLEGMGADWENDFNEYIFSENPKTIPEALDKIVALRKSSLGQSSEFIFAEGSNEEEDEDLRNAREFGVGADWFKRPPKSWFCEKVIAEVKAARSMLGDDAVRTAGLGLCSLYVDITSSLDEKMQKALELYHEPCTVEFDFDPFWALNLDERVPMPVFKIRQLTNNEGNSFGCGFHLKEIVHRYLEDNFKWSSKPLISLGSYNNDKGINQTPSKGFFSKGQKQQPHQAPAPQAAVDPVMVGKLKQLGFKQSAIETALAATNNHYERAVDKLISMGEAAIAADAHDIATVSSSSVDAILEMGFSRDQATKALKKANNNLDQAIALLLSDDADAFEPAKEEKKPVKMVVDLTTEVGPFLSRTESNLFVGIISYMKTRLAHYMRFCMICHKRHACHNEKPVVCCNPLCIFRYAEMMPSKQKEKMKEVDRITICPFVDCDNIARSDSAELLAAFGTTVSMEDGNNCEQMLAMQRHRYLPNDDVMKFINHGVKASGQVISKIENVLKPELVAAFEAQWEKMKKHRGTELSKPNIAYHGTAEANINSILERGLLVPGKGVGKDVGHATDSGWWGGGIYLAPDPALSISYCRGGKKLLICSVLMGKRYNVTQRMDGSDCAAGYDSHVACNGAEWVIFEPSQVLPCYLVSFKQ